MIGHRVASRKIVEAWWQPFAADGSDGVPGRAPGGRRSRPSPTLRLVELCCLQRRCLFLDFIHQHHQIEQVLTLDGADELA